MKHPYFIGLLWVVCWWVGTASLASTVEGVSVYTQRPADPEAFYFTPENYGYPADGKSDVTETLQKAIFQVKQTKGFGILFLPEGQYRISKTLQIPASIRLIGYGKKRPVIYLGAHTPGYQTERNYLV